MRCPFCGSGETRVIDSRPTDENNSIRRRRECASCQNRFTTYETVEDVPILVIKKNGTRQVYDRNKVLNSMLKACEGRQISASSMDKIADKVEKSLNMSMKREVESSEIGQIVMDSLKELDEVAYVRFASVYRNFKDVSSFMEELQKLIQEKNSKGENKI